MIGLQTIATALILVTTLAAVVRVLRGGGRRNLPLAIGQLIAGAMLYLLLFPPQAGERGGELTVLTPGATLEQVAAPSASMRIALPGAADGDGRIEHSPDLASALRRHPQTTRLHVIGHGLPARDRDAARGLAIAFEPAPLPDGIVELATPQHVQVGNRWRVAGRATPAGFTVELRDPADALAASAKTDAQGRFELDGLARAAGVARFSVRLVDAGGRMLDRIPVLVDARADEPLRMLVLAAVPGPELKYLRRWASDAGLVVDSRIGLSEGVMLAADAKPVDAALLAQQDLVIVDERRWQQLDAAMKTALLDGVDGGLGLLLRVTGPLSPELLTAWSALGVDLQAIDGVQPEALASGDDALALTPAPYRLPATLAKLVATRSGKAVVGWQPRGRGRIGVTTLTDSYRDVLAGNPDRHGSLWARIATTLARARAEAQPQLPALARKGERATLCGLSGDGWRIESGDEAATVLLPAREHGDCAAFWPSTAGTHRLVREDATWSFDVLGDDVAGALQAARTRDATQAVAGASAPAEESTSARLPPRGAWLLTWLLTMGLLWWAERRAWLRRAE